MQTLHYSEELIRRATWRTIFRFLGPWFFAALAFLAVFIGFELSVGNQNWLLGVAGTAFLFAVFVPLLIFRMHARAALEKLSLMGDGLAQIDFSAGQLHLNSALGVSVIPLSRISAVWCYSDYWVFLSGRSILMTLPLRGLSEGVISDWLGQLRDAGAKIT